LYARHRFVRDLRLQDLVLSIQDPILGLRPLFGTVDNWRNQLYSHTVIQGIYSMRFVDRDTERKQSLSEKARMGRALSPHFLVSVIS